MQVGFLGLGQMGSAIAERLRLAGIGLHVYDPHAAAMAPFVADGAIGHAGPEGVANEARIVFACLPNGTVSETVARDVALGGSVRIYIEMSTIGSPTLARVQATMEARGITLVDCPVSGGPKGARAGTLTVITAGPAWARDELRPLLHAIGGQVFEVGEKPGQAQLMKLVNNLVNAANMATAFEALVLGAKGGLDPDQMVSVLNASTGQNNATLTKVPRAVLTGSFDYGAALTTMVKDVTLGLREAEALGVPMWVHQQVATLWRFAEQQGLGREDFTALIKVLESWSATEVRGR